MNKIITIRCGMDNCYVLCSEDTAVLVDTGREKYRYDILEKIKKYPIQTILLTHGHLDHIGNAAFFAKEFGAKIGMHQADEELITNQTARELVPNGAVGKFVMRKINKDMRTKKVEPFQPDFYLEDGQSLQEFGIDATIVSLPGHTKGSIGIRSAGKSFIVGDLLMNFIFPSITQIVEDYDSVFKSIEKIKQSNAELYYVGHGKSIQADTFFK